jgi:hypothetical protein
MTTDRTKLPLLANVLRMVGPDQLTIDQRLCDAMFAIAIAGRGGSPKLLYEDAAKRVVKELEAIIRQRRKPEDEKWRLRLVHRRLLAVQITNLAIGGTLIDHPIKQRARELILSTLPRLNQRHADFVVHLANKIPTNAVNDWILYYIPTENKCSEKDMDIMKKTLYTCREVGAALLYWRELYS